MEPIEAAIRAELTATTDAGHFDETGSRIAGRLWWLHVVCTRSLRYDAPHRHRGSKALDAIGIDPAFQGPAMHDGYHSYFQYEGHRHVLCNSHHLRDLTFARDQYHQAWAGKMIRLLQKIKATVDAAPPNAQSLRPGRSSVLNVSTKRS